MESPSVVAVVVTYKRAEVLARTLERLWEQPSLRGVVVVDNAGEARVRDLASHGPETHYLALPDNPGLPAAHAAGIELAMTTFDPDYVWLFDDDDRPSGLKTLPTLIDAAQAGSANAAPLAAVGSWIENIDEAGSRTVIMRGSRWQLGVELIDHDADAEIYHCDVTTFTGLLASTVAIRDVGPPDASFFMAMWDVDWCLRARRAGYRIAIVPQPLIEREGSASFRRDWRVYYWTRNSILTARRLGHRAEVRAAAIRILRRLAGLVLVQRRLGVVPYLLRGVLDGLRGRTGRVVNPTGYSPTRPAADQHV